MIKSLEPLLYNRRRRIWYNIDKYFTFHEQIHAFARILKQKLHFAEEGFSATSLSKSVLGNQKIQIIF